MILTFKFPLPVRYINENKCVPLYSCITGEGVPFNRVVCIRNAREGETSAQMKYVTPGYGWIFSPLYIPLPLYILPV